MADDHYRVLGVDPAADLDEIKKAYRRKALECHPDRGGSHDQMVAVNEAWEILSDPDRRRRYDKVRGGTADPSAQTAAADDASKARQRAEQDPPRWADFVAWLNGVASDFTDARHGSEPVFGEVHLPTVENSLSGWLFIIVGAALAGFFISTEAADFCERNRIQWPVLKLVLILGPVIGGAWAGAAAHQAIGSEIKKGREQAARQAQRQQEREARRAEQQREREAGRGPVDPSPPPALEPRVLACERCGQKLRVPLLPSDLLVTCKSCGHKFSCPAG